MKAVFVTILALGASVLANPVQVAPEIERRQYDTQGTQLDTLLSAVTTHATNIQNAANAVSDNASTADKQAAADSVSADFSAINDLLNQATASLTTASKRDILLFVRGGCDSGCLKTKIISIVTCLASTIKCILAKLGLTCVLKYLTPLIVSLSGFLKCTARLVDGLLDSVKSILNDALSGVGIGILSLLPW